MHTLSPEEVEALMRVAELFGSALDVSARVRDAMDLLCGPVAGQEQAATAQATTAQAQVRSETAGSPRVDWGRRATTPLRMVSGGVVAEKTSAG